MKKIKVTKTILNRRILELKSQLAHSYHFASAEIHKASTDRLMASGCLLQLTDIGGKEIINPILIKDGLSPDTIAAIKKDIQRSYDLAILFKP
jgi:hypothetical protein